MAERKSSMGGKTMLSRLLTQERITGTDREIAATHEINRQSAVKEIIAHVFFMSKFQIISPPLAVGEAKSQYYRATGDDQAAHNAPGQILQGTTPIQELITTSDDLRITVENLFGKTDGIHSKFNKADSRAEENGLRDALLVACDHIAEKARYARFNRTFQIHSFLATAFDRYKTAAAAAYLAAETRQRALMNRNDPNDVAAREELIYQTLRWWLIGKAGSMIFIGLLTWVGLWILGVPLALTLGLIAGLLSFIPNFGPIMSAVPAILLAFIDSPITALYVLGLYVLVQLIESNVVTPFIERETVELPPALTITFQLVLGVLVGGLGLVLATPLLAAIVVAVQMLYIEDVLGGHSTAGALAGNAEDIEIATDSLAESTENA